MVDAGVGDGDYLIVEPCETADSGRTVVAEIDGHVTVKKLFRSPGGQVRLQPANPEMLPLIVRSEQVRIRGVVVGGRGKYRVKAAPAARPPGCAPAASPRRAAASGATTAGRCRHARPLAQ